MAEMSPGTDRFPHRTLIFIAVAAALLRLLWITYNGSVIENEGAEYARIADNLRAGRGYVGMLGGRQTLFPPLYPFLIAAVSALGLTSEWAGRLISFAAGIALLWPIFGVARMLSDTRAGILAAILVAVHGLTIALAGAAYSESLYLFATYCALYFSLRLLEQPTCTLGAAAGASFGLAYLTRPEAIIGPLVLAACVLAGALARREPTAPAVRATLVTAPAVRALLVAVLVSVSIAAPYVAWLSINSGYLRWEGKSLTNAIIAQRMIEGESYLQASRGLTAAAEPRGVYMFPDQFSFRSTAAQSTGALVAGMVSGLLARGVGVARDLLRQWTLGAYPLFLLAAIGWISSAARLRRPTAILFITLMLAASLGALLTMQHRWERHLYPFALLCLPLAAIGLSTSARVLREVGRRLQLTAGALGIAEYGAIATVLSLLALKTVAAIIPDGEFAQARAAPLKEVGLWLREQRANATVMDLSMVPAYYAAATVEYLPWAEAGVALKYIHSHPADYIVLRSQSQWQAPYMSTWLAGGIPDPCASPVKTFLEHGDGRIVVYSWTCG